VAPNQICWAAPDSRLTCRLPLHLSLTPAQGFVQAHSLDSASSRCALFTSMLVLAQHGWMGRQSCAARSSNPPSQLLLCVSTLPPRPCV